MFMTKSCWGLVTRVRLPCGRPRRLCHQQCTSSASMCASRQVWRCHRYLGWERVACRLLLGVLGASSTSAWWSFVFLGLGDKGVTCSHIPARVPLSSQLPTPPKINFLNFRDSWNSGRPLCPCLGDVWAPQALSQPCLPHCSFPLLHACLFVCPYITYRTK